MQTRLGGVACRQDAGADVAVGGDPRRSREQQQGRRGREHQHERMGAGERPQFLRPSQRRGPTKPAGAVRGVGDDAQHQGQPDDCAAQLERRPAGASQAGSRRPRRRRTPVRPTPWRARGTPRRRPEGRPGEGRRTPRMRGSGRWPRSRRAPRDRRSVVRGPVRERARSGPRPPRSAALVPRPAGRIPPRRSPASRPRARRCSHRR